MASSEQDTTPQRDTSTALPPGTWVLDAAATRIGFEAKLVLGLKVKGRFERHEAAVTVGAPPAQTSMAVTVWTDSLATGIKVRDGHLRADDVFAVDRFPTLEFHSTTVRPTATGYDVTGRLRVRDVTRDVRFAALADGAAEAGRHRYTAEIDVDPKDYGISRRGTTKPLKILLDVVLLPQPAPTGR